MAVDNIIFTDTGLVLPTESTILSEVQSDMSLAFGGGLSSDLSTPQGQLASSLTAIIGDKNNTFAEYVNGVDPRYAEGLMQDGIARIYFLTRKPALPTVVNCQCVGLAGTIIPMGALAISPSTNNIYQCTASGTIPIGGSITLPFACTKTGPIACAINSVTKIYQSVPGWDRVNNSSAGTTGQNVESRNDFEVRRYNSVQIGAQGMLASIYSAVFSCSGVDDVYVCENDSSTAVSYGATSYSMAANSVYVGVVGGYASDIAQAIFSKKAPGCNLNGSTSVTVYDMSGYTPPFPSYTIKFNIPASLAIKFAVTITNVPSLPSNYVTLIQNAITSAFAGGDGGPRQRIGTMAYASRFYSAVAAVDPSIEIQSILIGTSTATANTVAVGIDQMPTVGTITVTAS